MQLKTYEQKTFAILNLCLISQLSLGSPEQKNIDIFELEKFVWTANDQDLFQLEDKIVRLIQREPHSAYAHYLLSHLLIRQFSNNPGDLLTLKKASEIAQQAIDLDPVEDIGFVALAEILDLMGNTDKAIQLLNYERNGQSFNKSWRTYFTLARLYADRKNSEHILELLEKALSQKPTQDSIIIPYVVAILQTSFRGELLEKELLNWNKKFPNNLFKQTVAISLADRGEFNQAHQIYLEILKEQPHFLEAQINDAIILYKDLKQGKKSIEVFEKVLTSENLIKLNTHIATVYLHLGAAYLSQNENKKAHENFFKAVSTSPEQLGLLDFINNTYRKFKKLDQFANFLSHLNRELPGKGIYYAILGEVLSDDLKHHEQAIKAFDDAILLEPERSDFYNGIGLTYYRMKKINKALEFFTKAVEIDPNDATARYNEACMYSRLGKTTEALGSLQEAINLDPRLQETAKTDSDFESIRHLTQFNQIINGKGFNTTIIDDATILDE